jgi:hypothetical protein
MKDGNVRLKDEEDQLIWSLNPVGAYVPKIGYKALIEEGREGHHFWWWKTVWKLRCSTKNKIFIWLIIYNKAPTWEVL